MHQTFYIDTEEEISSIIDRLNKSMAADNYFVVPKRAIFLQSIVNLKLLKREADKVGKHVIIVTQDEIGGSMAERSGISVRSTLDGLEPVQEMADEAEEDAVPFEVPRIVAVDQQEKRVRLSGVGSNEFYDSAPAAEGGYLKASAPAKSASHKISINSIAGAGRIVAGPLHREIPQASSGNPARVNSATQKQPQQKINFAYGTKLDLEKQKTLEKMYAPRDNKVMESANVEPVAEGKIKKIFIGFIGLCLLAFAGVAAYLLVPSAKIILEPNILKNKIDLDLHGGTDIVQADQKNISLRVLDKEESVTLASEVKGGSATAGKKAHGSVVIYNQYDNSPQTLIATTRLESADGKIFRLVKNVVVPGMTTVAGETKPGVITADVIADQSGPDYNLEPTSFTIPGFKDGPKYDKFSAKSTETMTGGSTDGQTAGGAIVQSDIDNAKRKTETALKEKIAEVIKGELQDGEMALDQAEKITITKSAAKVKIGDMVGSFDYTATASIHVLVFSENDVKKNIEQSIVGDQQGQKAKKDISKIEYGTVDADFDKNTLELKVHGEITITPIIDKEQIKQELLGKTDDQLPAILRKNSEVKSANVEFWPTIVSRIPQYAQRVTVEIKNGAN